MCRYVNSLITSVKKELSVRSSTTAVPDIDLYQILMNQHKVQVFHDVVKMIKKPRVIQAQNLYSYRVVAQSSPFSGALAMQKVSRSKTVFSDAFKEYNDPYKFLQVLKGKDIPASEYYKYFVNISLCVGGVSAFANEGHDETDTQTLIETQHPVSSVLFRQDGADIQQSTDEGKTWQSYSPIEETDYFTYDTDWIHQRLLSIRVRNELTAEWQERGVQQGKEYVKQKETADQGPP